MTRLTRRRRRSRPSRLSRRPAVLAVAAALGSLAVAGCSPAHSLLGITSNTAVLSNRPALTASQASAIATRALGLAQHADALRTQQAAQSAFTGLALREAKPRYTVEKALDPSSKGSGAALEPAVRPSRIVVTAGRAFPRSLLATWKPQGATAQQVAVLDSPDVRTPFRVAERADLLPGAALPAMPPNVRGASLLGPDVEGLVATPRQTVADLAALLQTGHSKTPIADNIVVRDVRSKAAAQAKGVKKVATFAQTHVPEKDALRVLRTADGGALVIAAVDRYDRFKVKKGAGVINTPSAYRALAPKLKKITRWATVKTVQVAVLAVPAQGKGSVRLLAFREVPVAVAGR